MPASQSRRKTPIPYVSLFSGAGGLDLGLDSTGLFSAKLCVESEPAYYSTLVENQGKEFFDTEFLRKARLLNQDVFSEASLEAIHRCRRRGQWGIVGGPPCQSFSSLGHKKGAADPRGDLTIRFFQLIAELEPTFFVFENVAPFGQNPGEKLRKRIFGILDSAGYSYSARVANMADYGCFTKRKRLIILGRLHAEIAFPVPTHSREAALFARVGHIDAEFERLANVLLGRSCGNPALITYPRPQRNLNPWH